MGELYDLDVFEWSQHQAALLRRAAAGEAVQGLDMPHIIDEVASVGRGQLSAVRARLAQALAQDLKAEAWPLSREVPHWRAEARRCRGEAAEAFTAGMRQRIDMASLYRQALRYLPDAIDDQLPLPVPQSCPVTLDEMIGED